jgi:hypothetical protein
MLFPRRREPGDIDVSTGAKILLEAYVRMIQQHVISLLCDGTILYAVQFLVPTLYRKIDAMNNSKQPPLAILFPQPGNIDVSPFSRDSLLAFFLTDNKYAGKHAVSSIP